jgi:hypothetical protein
MTRQITLLCRILDALRESQTLHELTHRLAASPCDAAGYSEPEVARECSRILQEHACLVTDIENELRDALAPRVRAVL